MGLPMTIEEAIAKVNSHKLTLSNLFQFEVTFGDAAPAYHYQANVRSAQHGWDFGIHENPAEAILIALHNALTRAGDELIAPAVLVELPRKSTPRSIEDLGL